MSLSGCRFPVMWEFMMLPGGRNSEETYTFGKAHTDV